MERTHGGEGETAVETIVKITREVVEDKEDRLKGEKNHLEIMERLTACCHPQLFIFVEPNESQSEEEERSFIYVYGTIDRKTIEKDEKKGLIGKATINKSEIAGIKEKLKGYIREQNKEKEIINVGKSLYEKLFPPKAIRTKIEKALQSSNDKIKEVLIYCEDEDIDYAWEWISGKKKKLFRGNFFWGDTFHIVRIPEDKTLRDMLNTNLNFQIRKIAIMQGDSSCAEADICCFNDIPVANRVIINLQKGLQGSTNLNAIDCIHSTANIAGNSKDTTLLSNYDDAFESVKNSNSKLKFIFFNIRSGSNLMHRDQLLYQKKESTKYAEICIYNSLDLPDELEPFTKYFYTELWIKKNVVEAATIAREKIEKDKKLGYKKFWRLAYVVKGNPCARVTWTDNTRPVTTHPCVNPIEPTEGIKGDPLNAS